MCDGSDSRSEPFFFVIKSRIAEETQMWEFNWGVFWAVLAAGLVAGVILFPLWTMPLQNKLDLLWHKLDAIQNKIPD